MFRVMDKERKPTYDELVVENAQLKTRVVQLELCVAEKDKEIKLLKQEIVELKAQVDKLTKMLFGKKSEKSKKNKTKDPKPTDETGIDAAPKQKRKRGGGGRKPFPPDIPRRDVHVPLHPEECRCGECGKVFEPMGVGSGRPLHSN